MRIKYGDALVINGEGSNNVPEIWYAVAKQDLDAAMDDTVEVEYLVKDDASGIWEFEGELNSCPVACIEQHEAVDPVRGPQYAWNALGFRMLGPSTMVLHDHDGECPIGHEDFEIESDDDETDSMKDFIVQDSEVEPFTLATGSAHAADTHDAVRAWNNWQPKNDREMAAKEFIDRLASRAAHMDADRRMDTGMAPMESYTKPR